MYIYIYVYMYIYIYTYAYIYIYIYTYMCTCLIHMLHVQIALPIRPPMDSGRWRNSTIYNSIYK